MRTALYARVSKANRAGKTVSVDDQIADLHKAVKSAGGSVVGVYADRAISASGGQKNRPEWQRLLASIEQGQVEAVALWEISRSSRRLAEWAAFRDLCNRHGVVWITGDGAITDPASSRDRVSVGVRAVIAEEETEQLSARIRRTVRQRAKEGRPHGREVFGYRRLYSPTTGALIGVEEEPSEAVIVRRVFREVIAGRALRAIARDLNSEGVPCPSAATAQRRGRDLGERQWNGRQVGDLIRRKAYTGVRVHTSSDRHTGKVAVVEHQAVWPALVSEDDFTTATAIIDNPARWTRPADANGVRHWLSGVLRCGKCGSRMRVHSADYYACDDSTCRGATVNREGVEELLGDLIVQRLSRPDAQGMWAPRQSGDVEEARLVLAQAEKRLEDLAAAYAAGKASLAAFTAAESALGAEIARAKDTVQKASVQMPEWVSGDIAQEWPRWTPQQRNMVARVLFTGIEVAPVGRTGRPRKGQPRVPIERLTFHFA